MNEVILPTSIKPITQTIVLPEEKFQILTNLTKYIIAYVREQILALDLTDNPAGKIKFIEQCKIACKLATKIIQEGKNHKGDVYFTDINYYGKLENIQAIGLYHILIGKSASEGYEEQAAAENLDKLCKHKNTIFNNRKLSFWGTNYTNHAIKFREWINQLETVANPELKTEIMDIVDINNQKLNNYTADRHVFCQTLNAEEAEFLGTASFRECEFWCGINLSGTQFKPGDDSVTVDFSYAIFAQMVDFTKVSFHGVEEPAVRPIISFKNAQFKEGAIFGKVRGRGAYAGSEIDFRGAKVADGKYILFDESCSGLGYCTIRIDSSILHHFQGLSDAIKPTSARPLGGAEIYLDDQKISHEELEELIR
jgi:hypothetical protein